ncbi:MAG: heme A synthase [Deltaproteobacteria bacterium]|nr:heme A synthase [Deltaproteobacteria bacterium]
MEVRKFGTQALGLASLCFALMVLGSIVRTTDSGLSCPDWPMCFGALVPSMDIQVFLEWFHRLVALCLGILLFWMSVKVIRSPILRVVYSKEIAFALALFLFQCVLGGLTVLRLLDPSVVSSHLLTALIFLSTLLWMWRRSTYYQLDTGKHYAPRTLITTRLLLTIATLLLYLQLGIGGMVSSNHASLVCPDFPTCFGQWIPPASFHLWVQMIHRFVGVSLFVFALFLALRRKSGLPLLTGLAIRFFAPLMAVQIVIGVASIYYALPLWAVAGHHANAVLIFSLLIVGTMELYLTPQLKRGGSFGKTRKSARSVAEGSLGREHLASGPWKGAP